MSIIGQSMRNFITQCDWSTCSLASLLSVHFYLMSGLVLIVEWTRYLVFSVDACLGPKIESCHLCKCVNRLDGCPECVGVLLCCELHNERFNSIHCSYAHPLSRILSQNVDRCRPVSRKILKWFLAQVRYK